MQAEHEQHNLHPIRIPFPHPRPTKEAKYTLPYSKPANINVVGSYARNTTIQIGDQLGIDLAVTMPSVRSVIGVSAPLLIRNKSIFQEKDYLNYRYFYKRAYYLACIATGIEEAEDCTFAVRFAYQNDNHLQPVIILDPGQGSDDFSKSDCQIRIILAADGAMFPLSKTLPHKNCVRANLEGSAPAENSTMPTPFYNASLRSECSSLAYLKYLYGASLQSDGFTDACVLGSVWLRQRGLRTGLAGGGFGSFEWACTMALLLHGGGPKGKPLLSKAYNPHQLFKAMLQYLSMKDLVAGPVAILSDIVNIDGYGQPVLFDGARGLNVLFKMSPWSYAMLRYEATRTLKLLNDPLLDQFDASFITNIDNAPQRFDSVVDLSMSRPMELPPRTADAIDDDMHFCRRAYQALKSGLGDRVLLIHLRPPGRTAWSSARPTHPSKVKHKIRIGLILDPGQINRSVDRGPSAEDKVAAAAFRQFWGEKAELRRFKDGSIQESLIWSATDARDSILKQIVTHIIRRHLGEEAANDINLTGDSFNRLLDNKSSNLIDPSILYQPVINAFEVLEKDIRHLQGLPLQIRQISAADSQLRYASANAPVIKPGQYQLDPANVFVQFEGSSRWPDDIAAVQRTKIAFLLKMGELLAEATTGLTTRLGLENNSNKLLNSAFLDVLYPEGAFFRLRIHHEREFNLLEKTLKDKSHTQTSREETASALSAYKRNFIQAPLHTQAIRTLSTRFPLLSPSIRLMKKWRDSHLLSHHISDELIELLTVRIFVHPGPWSVPGSVMTGFLRTLRLISKWDWRSEPLIVDFNGEMSSKEIEEIHIRFEAWRKIDPAMNRVVMFAASNLDPDGITWTELGPSKVVAARFTSLAEAACGVIKEQGVGIEPEMLFAACMVDYDFLVHLNTRFVGDNAGQQRDLKPVYKNFQVQVQGYKSLVGFNSVQSFVEELRTLYDTNVVFFHNEQGGSVVAGLWNPQTGLRPWKTNLQYSTMPVTVPDEESSQVTVNKMATLHDIARLGGDMISRIEVKK